MPAPAVLSPDHPLTVLVRRAEARKRGSIDRLNAQVDIICRHKETRSVAAYRCRRLRRRLLPLIGVLATAALVWYPIAAAGVGTVLLDAALISYGLQRRREDRAAEQVVDSEAALHPIGDILVEALEDQNRIRRTVVRDATRLLVLQRLADLALRLQALTAAQPVTEPDRPHRWGDAERISEQPDRAQAPNSHRAVPALAFA